jgi:hypothetical protein
VVLRQPRRTEYHPTFDQRDIPLDGERELGWVEQDHLNASSAGFGHDLAQESSPATRDDPSPASGHPVAQESESAGAALLGRHRDDGLGLDASAAQSRKEEGGRHQPIDILCPPEQHRTPSGPRSLQVIDGLGHSRQIEW